jgi:hypothetical protein
MNSDLAAISASLGHIRIQEEGSGGYLLIFTQGERKGYYTQSTGSPGESSPWAKAVGNRYLRPEFAPTRNRTARLEYCGRDPRQESASFHSSYWEWEAASEEDRLELREKAHDQSSRSIGGHEATRRVWNRCSKAANSAWPARVLRAAVDPLAAAKKGGRFGVRTRYG